MRNFLVFIAITRSTFTSGESCDAEDTTLLQGRMVAHKRQASLPEGNSLLQVEGEQANVAEDVGAAKQEPQPPRGCGSETWVEGLVAVAQMDDAFRIPIRAAATAADCSDRCTEDFSCTAWDWRESDGRCQLTNFDDSSIEFNPSRIDVGNKAGHRCPPQECGIFEGEVADYQMQDPLRLFAADDEATCSGQCADNEECSAWDWRPNDGQCRLTQVPAVIVIVSSRDGRRAGRRSPPPCDSETRVGRMVERNAMRDGYLGDATRTLGQCMADCTSNNDCTAWTWVNDLCGLTSYEGDISFETAQGYTAGRKCC